MKITSDINSAEMLLSFCYFELNKLRIKRKKCFKFYHLFILQSGDLNPSPKKIKN